MDKEDDTTSGKLKYCVIYCKTNLLTFKYVLKQCWLQLEILKNLALNIYHHTVVGLV